MKSLVLAIALIFSALAGFCQTKWKMASGSVSFTIKNMGSTVKGSLGGLNTNIVFSPDKLASSSLRGSVTVSTINTDNSKRDKDLQGEKYFNAGEYKLIEVRSVRLGKADAGYTGTFNVTIKGVTRQMTIPFAFTQQGRSGIFRSDFTINRRDFGVGTKSGLAMAMGDDVHVHIEIKVVA